MTDNKHVIAVEMEFKLYIIRNNFLEIKIYEGNFCIIILTNFDSLMNVGLNVFIFQIHDSYIQHSTIINRGFERKPKAYRVHLLQQQINLLSIVIWQKLKQT